MAMMPNYGNMELFYFAAKTTIGGYGRSGATQEGFGRNDNNISNQSRREKQQFPNETEVAMNTIIFLFFKHFKFFQCYTLMNLNTGIYVECN